MGLGSFGSMGYNLEDDALSLCKGKLEPFDSSLTERGREGAENSYRPRVLKGI